MIRAQARQRGQAVGVHGAGIDLDRVFAAGHQAEAAAQHGHQLGQFVVVGRTTASGVPALASSARSQR